LKRSAEKFKRDLSSRHLGLLNNPEEAAKAGIVCVNNEDSSGSGVPNKGTAATTQQSNVIDDKRDALPGQPYATTSSLLIPRKPYTQLTLDQA